MIYFWKISWCEEWGGGPIQKSSMRWAIFDFLENSGRWYWGGRPLRKCSRCWVIFGFFEICMRIYAYLFVFICTRLTYLMVCYPVPMWWDPVGNPLGNPIGNSNEHGCNKIKSKWPNNICMVFKDGRPLMRPPRCILDRFGNIRGNSKTHRKSQNSSNTWKSVEHLNIYTCKIRKIWS